MELVPRPAGLEQPTNGILARVESAVSAAGERVLVERLHQALDENGAEALSTFSTTLLPQVQTLLATLPHLVHDQAEHDSVDVVRTLGTNLHERGVALEAIMGEGIDLHDRLLREVAAHLRENDRPIVEAMSQLSHAFLKVGRHALLAYYESATATLAELAHSDSLTGLANRRQFDVRFGEELLRAQRTERPLALMMIDMNDLKGINDTYGHASGDEMLRVLASLLRGQTRGIDVAARIGGDEFAVLLPDTDRGGAMALLDRLQQGVEEYEIPEQAPHFSAGIAIYPEDSRTIDDLVQFADSVLYQAKRAMS